MAGKFASHMSKPVASTRTSTGVSRPSAVTMPVGVIREIPVVSRSTSGRVNAG